MTEHTTEAPNLSDGRPLRPRDVRGRTARGAEAVLLTYATTDLVGLRMSGPLIDAVDAWRLEQSNPVSRSEAIRRFVRFALSAAPMVASWSYDPRLEEGRRKVLRDLALGESRPRRR